MKKLISRALTLVVIAGTISNTTHCRIPKAAVNKAAQLTRKVTAANTAVVQSEDNNATAKEKEAKREAAKKAAKEARTWLDSVSELSGTTKLLLSAIATTGVLVGVDYGVAYYTEGKMGGYTAAALSKGSDFVKPYMEQARTKVSSALTGVRNRFPSWLGGSVPVQPGSDLNKSGSTGPQPGLKVNPLEDPNVNTENFISND